MPLPRKLKNINLFVDGRTYIGKVTSLTPPKLTAVVEEHRGGGMNVPIDYTMGFEKLEAEWVLAEVDKHLLKLSGLQLNAAINAQFRAVIDDEMGNVGSVVVNLTGKITEADLGEWKPGENSESKFKMSVIFYEMKVDSETVVYIDAANNVWTIGKVDQMLVYRALLEGGDAGTARALASAAANWAASKVS
ncbi:MAG: phage major tail tube protein [Kiritimatiellales bacterium]